MLPFLFTALSHVDGLDVAHSCILPFRFGNQSDRQDAPMLTDRSAVGFQALSVTPANDPATFVKGAEQADCASLSKGSGPYSRGENKQ